MAAEQLSLVAASGTMCHPHGAHIGSQGIRICCTRADPGNGLLESVSDKQPASLRLVLSSSSSVPDSDETFLIGDLISRFSLLMTHMSLQTSMCLHIHLSCKACSI